MLFEIGRDLTPCAFAFLCTLPFYEVSKSRRNQRVDVFFGSRLPISLVSAQEIWLVVEVKQVAILRKSCSIPGTRFHSLLVHSLIAVIQSSGATQHHCRHAGPVVRIVGFALLRLAHLEWKCCSRLAAKFLVRSKQRHIQEYLCL